MTYVMADLHGRFAEYRQMLELICFSGEDQLYLLGDLCDRGPESAALLLDVMDRKNTVCLKGNHEDMACKSLPYLFRDPGNLGPLGTAAVRRWYANGGEETYRSLMALAEADRQRILAFMKKSPLYLELTVAGQPYLLMHTLSELFSANYSITAYEDRDFLWERPKNFDQTFRLKGQPEGVKFLIGHTPTLHLGGRRPEIFFGRGNVIDLDCGAGYPEYGGRLGCLCLETKETYYI
ncbi:MAG: serine/threonine protein phosphatase [Clostridia bacterium]|nr:serine/threonine protein phosphatase [Clostridia bacterium]